VGRPLEFLQTVYREIFEMTMRSAVETQHRLPIRYLLVLWLLVLSAVAYLDRTNIAIAGVQIGRDFKIDNAHLGWVFSAFLIGYASFQIPGGVLARRFGPRRILAISVLWWGLFTALTALAPPGVRGAVLLLILIRFSLGAGEAIMYPAASQFVERWFPVDERGKANGIIFGGVGLGSGLTPPLLTAVILRYGWRSSFWLCAAIGVVAGLAWYLIARDSPEEHPLVSASELQHIARGRGDLWFRTGSGAGNRARQAITPWRGIFVSKEIAAITISYFTYGYVAWIFFSWFYIYLAEVRGLNLKTSAVYSMLPFIAMTLGCLLGGAASDWIARRHSIRAGRCFLPALALGCTSLLLLVGSRAQSAEIASVVLACGAGTLYVSQSCFWSVTADIAGEHAGVASGVMNMGGQLGGAVTASLTPFIASRLGWNASFLTATLLAAVGALAWLVVDPSATLTVVGSIEPATEPAGS
jgi:ACS family glucarate transporter-like MFS transporter